MAEARTLTKGLDEVFLALLADLEDSLVEVHLVLVDLPKCLNFLVGKVRLRGTKGKTRQRRRARPASSAPRTRAFALTKSGSQVSLS